jgi:hypothetical protein
MDRGFFQTLLAQTGLESSKGDLVQNPGRSDRGLGYRHVPLRLFLMLPHHLGDNTPRTQILDWARCRKHELFDRLCNRIANIPVRLYSGEPVLHLRVLLQHSIMAQK